MAWGTKAGSKGWPRKDLGQTPTHTHTRMSLRCRPGVRRWTTLTDTSALVATTPLPNPVFRGPSLGFELGTLCSTHQQKEKFGDINYRRW